MTYTATSLGVTIMFEKGQDITWFIEMSTLKGGTVQIEMLA